MPASPRVITRAGTIRGVIDDGIEAYRGIPYAAPTAGENRFRPPQPRAPWSGELDVTAYGKTCPQWVLIPERSEPAGPVRSKEAESKPPEGEDCLVLNVWTPNSGDAGKRPVMVWLHGGGFTSGSGSQPGNRGTRLARRGDVVVVTLNHRLGVLGFLELAELGGAEYADSGNAGALDMVAALEWVRDEIAAFGGDPENVTIFGCSGGGGKVSTLLGMPRADALYRRAIIESGPVLHGIPLREATGTARAVLEALGLDDADVKALSDVPASELVAASKRVLPNVMSRLFANASGHRFGPVVDGRSLPAHPFDPTSSPSAADVPLIIGSNKDELAFLTVLVPDFESRDPEEHLRILRAFAGDRSDDVLDVYRRTRPGATSADLAVAAMSAPTRAASITLAERKLAAGTAPVYMYLFAHESDAEGGRLKAYHGGEVPFVFNLVDEDPRTGSWQGRQGLADAISDAWIAFARTGDPGHPGLPVWPRYNLEDRPTMIFDRVCSVDNDPVAEERHVWAGATIHMD